MACKGRRRRVTLLGYRPKLAVTEIIGWRRALVDPTGQLGPSVGIHQIAREHFGPNAVRGGELVSDLAELALPTCDKGHPVAA